MSSAIGQEAIFIGANKQNFVSDYNPTDKILAYGAANTVALWKPLDKSQKGVYSTLKNHDKEITGVKFIPNSPFLISVAEDYKVNVWKNSSSNNDNYDHFQELQGHEHSVTCLAAVNEKVFVTGGADRQIIIWTFDEIEKKFKLGERLQVKPNFYPLCLAIQDIDNDGHYLLSIGGTSNLLFIYTFNLNGNNISNLSKAAELSGHEDWIKCLQFVTETQHKNYILASGAQDRYVRLWRLKLNELIDDSDEDETKLILLSNKQYKFNFGSNSRAAFSFEALIMGHDDWVTGLQWHPSYTYKNNKIEKKLQLLTSTADTALMIWEMDVDSGIWVCVSRLGEMSIKGASTATGASGGFWSCLWFVDDDTSSQYVLASGKTGSFRVYKSIDEEAKSFESVLGLTGPVKDVTDLKWSLNGEYFMATSLDQTTRLFAPWTVNRQEITWHEFARPQIHGYDMICYDNITASRFVSGGDEKVLRVFEMTKSINTLLKNLCGIDVVADQDISLPESASLPVLGLSNKAANEQLEAGDLAPQQQGETDSEQQEQNGEKEDVLATLETPPLEEYLQRYTLFPEIEKLYGHGYEIVCCATSPSGTLIASACRSNTAKHAVIRIFNSKRDFQQSPQVLEGHNLTISSLEFSPNGKYLLAVSRDRQFSLWSVVDEDNSEFKLVELHPKPHTRILWDCSWVPNNVYGDFFVTVSRDRQIKIWKIVDGHCDPLSALKLSAPITSVSIYKGIWKNDRETIIAVGLEDGSISIFTFDISVPNSQFNEIVSFNKLITPADRIEKLSFSNKLHSNKLLLGVGNSLYRNTTQLTMADKFPEIETIGNDLPQDDELEGSDFLSRERELVGDEFTTEQDKEVLAQSDEDDEINEFKEQFPAVDDSVPEQQVVADEADEDDEFEDFGSAGATTTGEHKFEGESQPLKEWKERRDLEISEREKANAKAKEDIIAKAQETIDDFYENYNLKKEEHSKQTLKEEEEFLEKRDGFLKRGTLWDRVNELVDEVGELPEAEGRDKSRFKGLLTKLKGKENVPGAGGY
ncbi:ELP2 [[Candida] subhashii]|uniref:ELP2 n=1 Tax=[Candida] subhashii TaxID=561895 RepID=A0A8J5QLR5_9ASCO|nr:ELP2 [[Candida] subhashii]KAG7665412.1 ELP2 [[Candida] subhashii]